MRLVRYQLKNEPACYGWILEDKVGPIQGSIYGEYRRMEAKIQLSNVHLLAPAQPSKIICIGRNYAEHAKEQNAEVLNVPLLFLKPPSAILDPGDRFSCPANPSRSSTKRSWWPS